MPEIIQNWLGTKLGILIDTAPEKFARHTKDGKLLAQLLYNYGVIPLQILETVKESKNYYECYKNFIHLKPWLKSLGVIHDDCTLKKIAGGEGSTAISLFYSVYLALENKDRLYYLSGQKERRISEEEACQKFKVNWIPERFVSGGSDVVGNDLNLSEPLYDNPDMIAWHKTKCRRIVEQIKRTKGKFEKVVENKELRPVISKHSSWKPLKKQTEAEEVREAINEFEKSHPYESRNLNYSELTELQKMNEMEPCFVPSLSEGKNMVKGIKRRKRGEVYSRNFQKKMENFLLEEQWREMIGKEEKNFESRVCENLLKQSQYEKQMTTKLYLLRNQKKVLTENRRKIECLKIDQRQKEYEETAERNLESKGEYWEEEEIERERIEELHRRLYEEKVRLRREMIRRESRKIYEAFVNISIRISEFREYIGCQIPKSLMKDLKELFYKDLPIFDILDHLEDLHLHPRQLPCEHPGEGGTMEGEDEYYQNEQLQKARETEMDRQSILDECDFNDYLNLIGPWMVELLLPNGPEREGRQLVLGYIVHKILAFKYPSPNVPTPVNLKPMKTTSVVLGLYEDSAIKMLADLMKSRKILVVRVEDAINFVLSAYKEELSVVRDVDVVFQTVTEDAFQKKNSNGKEVDDSRKLQLLKRECSEVLETEGGFMVDKEVQTPRMIPEDDPLLSPNAELGKRAFEALGAGDPVPDTVIASSLVAYVVSQQENHEGLVILNYPNLYSQACDLEYVLTGSRILPPMEEMENLEESEGFSYRGPWGGNSYLKDPFGDSRFSKLVPRPEVFAPVERVTPKSYFDCLIKMKKILATPRRRSEDSVEFGQMEKFYLDLKTLFYFEYQNLNFQTVKNLGKQILGVEGTELEMKTSSEVFGSGINELNEKWEPKRKSTKDLTGGLKKASYETREEFNSGGRETSEEVLGEESRERVAGEMTLSPPQPGDSNWEWATGPLPDDLLTVLAGLWENMEAIYIEDFKNLFFCLRVHRSNVYKYCGHIRNSVRTLMRRPDDKQKVLGDFQQMFNDIDEDLRPDVDVKCELHVRVSELEQALMSIADERKKNSLRDATNVAQDGWVPDEMANLVNIFLGAFQLEVDRSIDSCQVIMDYYNSLQERGLDAKPIGRIVVPKVQAQDHWRHPDAGPMETKFPGYSWTCKKCGWKCLSEESLREHTTSYHLEGVVSGGGSSGEVAKGSPMRMRLNAGSTPERECMICGYRNNSVLELEKHINRHFDYSECQICGWVFTNVRDMEIHVNAEHRDVLTPRQSSTPVSLDNRNEICPVCSLSNFKGKEERIAHVKQHFLSEQMTKDRLLAMEIQRREEVDLQKEQKEFEMLKGKRGMDKEGNFGEQSLTNMERAVYAGEMSVSDFHEKKIELRVAESRGIDDGNSCTRGLIPKIKAIGELSTDVAVTVTCTTVDHYASTYGDRGWGCGYRNLQMLISSLLHHTGYNQLLKGNLPDGGLYNRNILALPSNAVPSITKLQQHIEWAWRQGFDVEGCEQLEGKLQNTRKWIGATEIVTALSSLRIRCQLVDFHQPTAPGGSHPRLFNWVWEYFRKGDDFKPPLYLQHQGHSRTIVGIEKSRNGNLSLLVFDPSHTPEQMSQLNSSSTAQAGMRLIRRTRGLIQAPQYQLVAVRGIIDTEREYQESKILLSTRIP